jgi:opacity protein-like surface antigen
LGVEIDAELSDLNWNVSRSTDRVYSVERKESYGAGARLGVVVNDATLLYGRAGPVRTRFTTDYLRQDTGDHVIQDDRLTGWRFGGGVELPASDHTFLRLDYSYTRYGDYSVDYASGVDSFDNSEALVRLGVGFRY